MVWMRAGVEGRSGRREAVTAERAGKQTTSSTPASERPSTPARIHTICLFIAKHPNIPNEKEFLGCLNE